MGAATARSRARLASTDPLPCPSSPQDLRYWTVGWIDWNLLLDATGGPNHLKNLCDANIIQNADKKLGEDTLIKQAGLSVCPTAATARPSSPLVAH